MSNYKLMDAVSTLHDVARIIESEFGACRLSEDVRDIADRLNLVTKPMPMDLSDKYLAALAEELKLYV